MIAFAFSPGVEWKRIFDTMNRDLVHVVTDNGIWMHPSLGQMLSIDGTVIAQAAIRKTNPRAETKRIRLVFMKQPQCSKSHHDCVRLRRGLAAHDRGEARDEDRPFSLRK